MPSITENIDVIDEIVSSDPVNNKWIKYIMYPLFIIGLTAILISGYIELKFFSSIFPGFGWGSLLLVICLEGGKVGSIIFYEYIKGSSFIAISSTLKAVIWVLRLLLIVFSIICSFSKVSEYLNNPNYEAENLKATSEITASFKTKYRREDSLLQKDIDTAYNRMYAIRNVSGKKYKEQKNTWENLKRERETTLSRLEVKKDSALTLMRTALNKNMRIKNQTIVGVYNTLRDLRFSIDFEYFYSWFTVAVAFFTTCILEFIIWAVFGIFGSLYKNLMGLKYESYMAMQGELEALKQSKLKDDLHTIGIVEKIKKTFSRGFGRAKKYVDEVEKI
jgi:hypothetical protein